MLALICKPHKSTRTGLPGWINEWMNVRLIFNMHPHATHPFLYFDTSHRHINTLRPRQDGRHFAEDTFKRVFLNENIRILIKISLKFVSKGLINNIPALVLIMAWHWPGDKPLSEPMMVRSLMHICITRPQWVNGLVQDCSESIVNALNSHQQSCTESSILSLETCDPYEPFLIPLWT